MNFYPVPPAPQPEENIYENLPSVTEIVEEMSNNFEEIEFPEEEKSEFSETNEIPEKSEEFAAIEEVKKLGNPEIVEKMTLFQFLAICLIFCLILLALNIMWNNLFTTLLICGITLPILRWFGKV